MILGGLAAVSTFRPGVALAALFCNFALEQWVTSQDVFFAQHKALTNYLTASVVAYAVVIQLLRFGASWTIKQYSGAGWATLSLFAFALMSTYWSVYAESKDAFLLALPYIIGYTVLCPLVVTKAKDLQDGLVATLVLGSILLFLLLTTTSWGYRGIIIHTHGFRGQAGGNPLAIGSMAGYVILMAALLNTRRSNFLWNIVRWALVLLGLVLCVMTQSRGQVFGALIAFVCTVGISRKVKGAKGIGGVVAAIVVTGILAAWAINEYAHKDRWEMGEMQAAMEGGRVNKTLDVLAYWADAGPMRWMFGIGSSGSFSSDVIGFYPHNLPGEVLAEEGLIGFGMYAIVLVLLVRALRQLWGVVRPYDDARGLFAVLCALLVYEFILSNKQGSLLGNQEFFGMTIIAGQLNVAVRRQLNISASGAKRKPPRLATQRPQVTV